MADNIPTAILGKTGLEVTRLGFGAMEIRGSRIWNGRSVTPKQANSILNAVLDSGINFIDTAGCYGTSEEFIGKFISKRRKEYYLATKCGCSIVRQNATTDDTPHFYTKENAFECLHTSLKRMQTEYVDIMQLHNPSVEQFEQGELAEALQKMRDQEKVRWIGISTTLPHLTTFLKMGIFDTFQIPYSALERDHEVWITKSALVGTGTIIRGGVARGGPAGGLDGSDRWKKYAEAKLDELRDKGESDPAFMLRFALTHPHINTIIVGTMQPQHLQENIKAVKKGPLPSSTYAEAKRRLDKVGVKVAS